MNENLNQFIERVKVKLVGYSFCTSKEGYLQFVKEDELVFRSVIVGEVDKEEVGFGASVTFKLIESIVSKKKIEDWVNDRPSSSIRMYNHDKLLGYESFKGFFDEPINLSNVPLESLLEMTEKAIKQDLIPFFEYWDNITVLLPWLEIENNDPNRALKLSNLFGSNGLYKKLVVWYLSRHPKYEDYKNFHVERYKQAIVSAPNNKKYKKSFEEFERLVKRLEKTSPLYEWDDSYLTPKPFKGVVPQIP